jgi:SSS family solute:Na+ symporter
MLHPDLDDPDYAYMTMVTDLLPTGMVGLIVAVLIAALVSTIDSGLNSFSTVFTLDIYCRSFRPHANTREIVWVGRVVTAVAALIAVACALAMDTVARNLFDLLQSIIAYLAPPMAAVFVVGIAWKRATPAAALAVLVLGTIISLATGFCQLTDWPNPDFWPHYMLLSFYLFAGLVGLMIFVSVLTGRPPSGGELPILGGACARSQAGGLVWVMWGLLAAIMAGLYVFFN